MPVSKILSVRVALKFAMSQSISKWSSFSRLCPIRRGLNRRMSSSIGYQWTDRSAKMSIKLVDLDGIDDMDEVRAYQ